MAGKCQQKLDDGEPLRNIIMECKTAGRKRDAHGKMVQVLQELKEDFKPTKKMQKNQEEEKKKEMQVKKKQKKQSKTQRFPSQANLKVRGIQSLRNPLSKRKSMSQQKKWLKC